MNWKNQLKSLEQHKDWDFAINLMKDVIKKNSNDMDAYLYMNYLLMNLLVEENYDINRHDYYANLLKKYFDESYAKFSHNPEYLYYTGRIASMSEWYFGIEPEDADRMIQDAMRLDPNEPIYKWNYYYLLDLNNLNQFKEAYDYAKLVLEVNSPIKIKLLEKGSLGEYILDMMTHWSKNIIKRFSR